MSDDAPTPVEIAARPTKPWTNEGMARVNGKFAPGHTGGPGRPRLHPAAKSLALWIREIDDPERIVWWYLCFIAGLDPDRAHPRDDQHRRVWEWARDNQCTPTDVPVVIDHKSRLRAQTTLVAYAHGLPPQLVALQARVETEVGMARKVEDPEMAALSDEDLARLALDVAADKRDPIDAVGEVRPLPPGIG